MSRRADIHVPPPALAPEQNQAVLAEVDRVLADPLFRSSRRCQILLRRIIELTLAGNLDSLKERALGVDVFNRPADYDTSQDPVVRATAAEIRKKLAQYYLEPIHDSGTRIELPAGAYHAEFQFTTPRVKEAVPSTTPPAQKRRIPMAAVVVAIILLGAVGAGFAALNWQHSPIEDLWEPILKAPAAVLVSVGLQAAYNPRAADVQDSIQGILRHEGDAPARAVGPDDLVLLRDRYVALEDARCLVRVTSLLERYRKPFRVRAGPSTSLADLRDTAAILIGAFDNAWSLRSGGQLRFSFTKDSEHDSGMVLDSQHPENTQWKLTNYWPDWDVPTDYAIVTRVLDATTDRQTIIAAGLTQYGTIGAGEFITNPEYFSEAARKLPRDWKRKNLQIVLSVPVVNRVSGRPRVLETHVW